MVTSAQASFMLDLLSESCSFYANENSSFIYASLLSCFFGPLIRSSPWVCFETVWVLVSYFTECPSVYGWLMFLCMICVVHCERKLKVNVSFCLPRNFQNSGYQKSRFSLIFAFYNEEAPSGKIHWDHVNYSVLLLKFSFKTFTYDSLLYQGNCQIVTCFILTDCYVVDFYIYSWFSIVVKSFLIHSCQYFLHSSIT